MVKEFRRNGEGKLERPGIFADAGRGDCYGREMEQKKLVEAAWEARERAYAPYSKFKVGAAVLLEDGRIFTGCNVENLSFGLTICAERVAIGTLVAAGGGPISCLLVVADTEIPVSPCGACRQVMAEFGVPRVVLANRREMVEFTMEQLLPRATAGILDKKP